MREQLNYFFMRNRTDLSPTLNGKENTLVDLDQVEISIHLNDLCDPFSKSVHRDTFSSIALCKQLITCEKSKA